jgi:hypothetical protein
MKETDDKNEELLKESYGKLPTDEKYWKKAENRFTKNLYNYAVLVFCIGMLIVGYKWNDRIQNDKALKHIEIVMATDKNCNECHLGKSFVNLFNHSAVKGNDNVVFKMMDNARIKRW